MDVYWLMHRKLKWKSWFKVIIVLISHLNRVAQILVKILSRRYEETLILSRVRDRRSTGGDRVGRGDPKSAGVAGALLPSDWGGFRSGCLWWPMCSGNLCDSYNETLPICTGMA